MKRRIVSALLVISLSAVPCLAADPILKGQSVPSDGIFFPEPDAVRLLREVEGCRVLNLELVERENLERSLREEIRQRDERDKECGRAIEAAKRGGSTWEKIKSAGKWILVSGAVGFVLGSAVGK